jgi:nucleoside-diphosphate-sugar epimerase
VEIEIVCDHQRMRPGSSEVERLLSDNGLITSLTGYAPAVTLEEGIGRTVEWFRNPQVRERYKADIYNV